jgi:hypothetical protein
MTPEVIITKIYQDYFSKRAMVSIAIRSRSRVISCSHTHDVLLLLSLPAPYHLNCREIVIGTTLGFRTGLQSSNISVVEWT